jgi:hypothetical protein
MHEKTEYKCSGWKAWHDTEPGGPPTLHVIGTCTFPTSGYSVALKPHVPQGINPAIYIMDKIVTKPTGNVSQVVTTVEIDYTEKTKTHYTEIEILPDNVRIPVKEVQ